MRPCAPGCLKSNILRQWEALSALMLDERAGEPIDDLRCCAVTYPCITMGGVRPSAPVDEVEAQGSSSALSVLQQVYRHIQQHRAASNKMTTLRGFPRCDKVYYLVQEPWLGMDTQLELSLQACSHSFLLPPFSLSHHITRRRQTKSCPVRMICFLKD